jgi:hypothetical protein
MKGKKKASALLKILSRNMPSGTQEIRTLFMLTSFQAKISTQDISNTKSAAIQLNRFRNFNLPRTCGCTVN